MPIPTPPNDLLFTAGDLGGWLGKAVTAEKSVTVERVVWGWLQPVLGLATRPQPASDMVFSWALELGGIAHENPAGLASRQLGTSMQAYSAERRSEILDLAAGGGAAGVPIPQGSFPCAASYPDPLAVVVPRYW